MNRETVSIVLAFAHEYVAWLHADVVPGSREERVLSNLMLRINAVTPLVVGLNLMEDKALTRDAAYEKAISALVVVADSCVEAPPWARRYADYLKEFRRDYATSQSTMIARALDSAYASVLRDEPVDPGAARLIVYHLGPDKADVEALDYVARVADWLHRRGITNPVVKEVEFWARQTIAAIDDPVSPGTEETSILPDLPISGYLVSSLARSMAEAVGCVSRGSDSEKADLRRRLLDLAGTPVGNVPRCACFNNAITRKGEKR